MLKQKGPNTQIYNVTVVPFAFLTMQPFCKLLFYKHLKMSIYFYIKFSKFLTKINVLVIASKEKKNLEHQQYKMYN